MSTLSDIRKELAPNNLKLILKDFKPQSLSTQLKAEDVHELMRKESDPLLMYKLATMYIKLMKA
jgi:hypothetical protein